MERAAKQKASTARKHRNSSRVVTIASYLPLAIVVVLLAGCATAGKVKVAPDQPAPAVAARPAPSVATGPSVVRHSNGHEGFVIKEIPAADERARAEFEQATALMQDAKYDKAIELLEKVIAQSPQLTAPHINIAIAYERINKPEQAEQHLKKALEAIPGHPVASNEYGLLLRKAGRFPESRLIFEHSLERFPEYFPVQKNLAILCDLYLRDAVCAAEHYEAYGKAVPSDPQVKLWLADLRNRSGSLNMTASAAKQGGSAQP